MDSGLLSLMMVAGYHGVAVDEAQLRHEFGPEPFTTQTILLAARKLGLAARLVHQPPDRLDRAPLPAVALDREGRFLIVGKYDAGTPTAGQPPRIAARVLLQRAGEAPRC